MPTYLIKPSIIDGSFKKFITREGLNGNQHNLDAYKQRSFNALSVFDNKRLVAVLPYFSFAQHQLLRHEASQLPQNLLIFSTTYALDPQGLVLDLKAFAKTNGKIMVHLPFPCPSLKLFAKSVDPYIDLNAFDEHAFVHSRKWLARQQQKWSVFDFVFEKFDRNRHKKTVLTHLKFIAQRFKMPKAKIDAELHDLLFFFDELYIGVLKQAGHIASVCFFTINPRRGIHFESFSFDEKLAKLGPGNALIFNSICYFKKHNPAEQFYFGTLYAKKIMTSYKLKWCDEVKNNFLYIVD